MHQVMHNAGNFLIILKMQMRVLSFNVWHGLDGNSTVNMGTLEPKGRPEDRWQATLEALKGSGAHLICLQEMNPAPRRSKEVASHLSYSQIHTIDNSGVRIGDWGLPGPLFSGITTLAKPELKLSFLGEYQLSGPRLSYASDFFCFRLKETRMALFGQIESSPWGKILVGNYHLHHGIELTSALKTRLNSLYNEKQLTETELRAAFDFCYAARERRLHELDGIKKNLDVLVKEFGFENIILAGDLNCSDESLEWKKVTSWGFVDCHTQMNPGGGGFTWDSRINTENHRYGQHFHFPWPINKISNNVDAREQLHQAFLENEFRLRRIDYLFARGPISQALRATTMFGNIPANGLFISDHFGVLSEFQV